MPLLSKHDAIPPSPPDTDKESVDLGSETPISESKTFRTHVVRDPRLIRLAGTHPFNVQAPLSDLLNKGFLTSKDLHFVRNHGAVPKINDANANDWEFTLNDSSLRRKQKKRAKRRAQNERVLMGRCRSLHSLWTGAPLVELLRTAGPYRRARYVCFEGADELPNSYYGTLIRLSWAMDPERGIMLAHRMNGEPLPLDYGRPLRVIVPGQIGGRSVKWLERTILTDRPSTNWYHIYDNRVLPTMKDERYAIYDLNTNSTICSPAHKEEVTLNNRFDIYQIQGYAYTGGGKRITRVEVTLDRGRTWLLTNISYPEDEYSLVPEDEVLFGGKLDISWRVTSFGWCFWDLYIPLSRFQAAEDMMSILGMMNNPWFRVVIHHEGDKLCFEHPTQPAHIPDGWMERLKQTGAHLTNGHWGEKQRDEIHTPLQLTAARNISMVNEKVDRIVTHEELRAHGGETKPWFVVHSEVYDGTEYLDAHPGGRTPITSVAGQDASDEFLDIPRNLPKPPILETVPLKSKTSVSPNTTILTFALDHPSQLLGLPAGQGILLRLRDPVTGGNVLRAYTPVSTPKKKGVVEILAKIYPRRSLASTSMTQSLDTLTVGEVVEIKGPVGRRICAVTGITPTLGIIRAALSPPPPPPSPDDLIHVQPTILLIYANRTEDDILCRCEVDSFSTAYPGQIPRHMYPQPTQCALVRRSRP
ncbi:nitrate reductase [Xylariaceae sp. FL0255]|nr:nitrate reductase [Xylariaceae sp. FL0255]